MLQFNKLRLAGFKSFIDGTDVVIESGLTGIVGPNGCGKSNLVEALRWAMGETSAKQMRGGEMDDVIFNGTSSRPPRNIAEVVISLDNAARSAPAIFNDFEEIEISRRIERGSGSTYRVNGREVRARDVQLLFADSATGARSTALVSQGRVGAVIAAKPTARRALLEEAAGITGLHSRRHEAELRLRAAETNLTRLDDVLGTLEVQFNSLKKQARQATRYRSISDHIRRAEAALYLVRWLAATEDLESGRGKLAIADAEVTELTRRAAAAATRQGETASELPALRQAEAEAAAELQRLVLAGDGLESESQRVETERQESQTRLDHVNADIERETGLAEEAAAAMRRLDAERRDIETARKGEAQALVEGGERLGEVVEKVEAMDRRLAELTEQVADDEARRDSLSHRIAELHQRKERLAARADDIAAQRAALEAEAVDGQDLTAAGAALTEARESLEKTRADAEAAETARVEASVTATAAQSGLQTAATSAARLEAEAQALTDILDAGKTDLWPPLIDSITVEEGYEAALGAALGDDLSAPADEPAPIHWRTLTPFDGPPPLPAGAAPLASFVTGSTALDRRLSQVGVVAGEEEGSALHGQLVQGQRLVSREGALWRWDGFAVSASATTSAAARLEQRNRLKDVRERLAEAKDAVIKAEKLARQASAAAESAAAKEKAARDAARHADAAHVDARESDGRLREQAAGHASHLATLAEATEAIAAETAETEAQVVETTETLAALPEPEDRRVRLGELRSELAEARALQLEHQAAHDRTVREAEGRQRRLDDMAREAGSWEARVDGATGRLGHLKERREAALAQLERLSARPAEIDAQRRKLVAAVEGSEEKRRAAGDRLADAESHLAEANRALKGAETELAERREEKIRRTGAVEQCKLVCQGISERAAERLDCVPDQLREIAGLSEDAEPPEIEAAERRVERLLRERDTMGPVNLRAEQESTELREQIDSLEAERGDLVKAIEKLRQGINELNREGRERLLASFTEVNKHFQKLFERLFGGGRAYLQLTESEDPLEAGLEIMASPPGKRLQILSLLSGGEQALAALSLLFAVFLTNPAPICVLDEVDAPLDDANVDRFCRLVGEIAHSSSTRFLIITHHRMTMARMDRLFGVTMAEQGASQMVSVDLTEVEQLRAIA